MLSMWKHLKTTPYC
ncbi:hypothetical protein D041_0753B, partial [Vibrio parahaemolyticus EKP-008]